MDANVKELAQRLLHVGYDDLPPAEQRILRRIARRAHVSRDVSDAPPSLTFGQRLSDKVAAFGGSWTFIIMFGVFLVVWAVLNSVILSQKAFDPYPYIFLNLILSMVAALQAPVIMMSQNRLSAHDRLAAQHDYEVNLKAELEIMRLHEKVDQLRTGQITDMLAAQAEQIRLLQQMLKASPALAADQSVDRNDRRLVAANA